MTTCQLTSEYGKYISGSNADNMFSLRLNNKNNYSKYGNDNNMSIQLNSGVGTETVKTIKFQSQYSFKWYQKSYLGEKKLKDKKTETQLV